MSFYDFQERVYSLLERVGGRVFADFSQEDGKHIARCSGGITMIGNAVSPKVTIKWGSGHTAVMEI